MGKNRSARHYTDNYYQAVCCFAHTAPLLLTPRALPALHVVHHLRPLHPVHQVPKDRISDRTLTAPPEVARRLQPMHHVHQCTTFTTTAGGGKSFRPSRCDTRAPLSSRIHSWPDDPKGGTIEAE